LMKLSGIFFFSYSGSFLSKIIKTIEDPHSMLQGTFDPLKGILCFISANPAAGKGIWVRGDSKD